MRARPLCNDVSRSLLETGGGLALVKVPDSEFRQPDRLGLLPRTPAGWWGLQA